MSYYKGGNSSYGGRGSGGYRGGGFRGSRDGETSWRGSRGTFNSGSSRGGGSSGRYFSNPNTSYESPRRSYMASSPSYSSRSRDDYHSGNISGGYTREVTAEYSGRDFGRGSPEPTRKRARQDSPSYMGSRRSHERGFTSSEYSTRNHYPKSSPGGGGFSIDKSSFSRDVRDTRSGGDFAFRKPGAGAPRGGFRGRSSRGIIRRGRRGFVESSSSFLRKRLESYGIRKKIGRSEYLRRLKQFRMKSSGRLSKLDKKGSDDDDDEDVEEDENEEEDDDEEKEQEDGEAEGGSSDEGKDNIVDESEATQKADADGGDGKENNESPEKKETVGTKKVKKSPTKKSSGGENKDASKPAEQEGETAKGGDDDKPRGRKGKALIVLKCPHCRYKGVSFRSYSQHLASKKHTTSIYTLSVKLRAVLTSMRMDQRRKQRILDDQARASNMKLKTFFCSICKLNYRTLKSEHQSSIAHLKMKEYLMPFCRICKILFKSPWAYQSHLSELLHLKRKAHLSDVRPFKDDEDISVDPNSFMVLDAVGSGEEDDESDDEKSDDDGAKEGDENKDGEATGEEGKDKTDDKEKKKKSKPEIKLGAEHCKLMEVYFCDLCKSYLPRTEDREKGLAIHCRSRSHLQRYVRHRDDKSLRRRAFKLHKEREKEKEQLKKKKTDGKGGASEPAGAESNELIIPKKEEEDKAWNEVDKELSDLLQEENGNKCDLEDDDSRQEGERYDRFRQSDKDGNNISATNGALNTSEINKIETAESEN